MIATRVEQASRDFLGSPYRINPLIGSAETPEVFVSSSDGFDCVTYIETVLARALARNSREFANQLKRLRYRSGDISWISRNHYMTRWIQNNARAGLVRTVSLARSGTVKDRVLDAVPGLPPQRQKFKCFPKRLIPKVSGKIETGDLIFFASTRANLDVFHCGIVVKDGDRLLLRHASRSQGGVVEQPLSDFLLKNRMAGILVARPLPQK